MWKKFILKDLKWKNMMTEKYENGVFEIFL